MTAYIGKLSLPHLPIIQFSTLLLWAVLDGRLPSTHTYAHSFRYGSANCFRCSSPGRLHMLCRLPKFGLDRQSSSYRGCPFAYGLRCRTLTDVGSLSIIKGSEFQHRTIGSHILCRDEREKAAISPYATGKVEIDYIKIQMEWLLLVLSSRWPRWCVSRCGAR